jgi:hypothetical protein
VDTGACATGITDCNNLAGAFDPACYLATLTEAPAEDRDDDGYAPSGTSVCTGGFPKADCDDTSPFINPDASEGCDAKDNDCDGQTDEDFTGQLSRTSPSAARSRPATPRTRWTATTAPTPGPTARRSREASGPRTWRT